jgi:protein TonB
VLRQSGNEARGDAGGEASAAAPAAKARTDGGESPEAAGPRAAAGNSPLDGPSDRALQPYFDQLRAKISQNIRYTSGQPDGAVLLRFSVDKRGSLGKVQLIDGESSSLLQQEALRGLRLAAPFPPLPAHWTKETASFTVRVLFRSEKS